MNPRDGFPPYSLSRGAPSATWVLLHAESNNPIEKCGGESGIRTHGCFHIAGFQDRFLQPLGHLSTPCPGQMQKELYYSETALSIVFLNFLKWAF